jgi:hypothetical protein
MPNEFRKAFKALPKELRDIVFSYFRQLVVAANKNDVLSELSKGKENPSAYFLRNKRISSRDFVRSLLPAEPAIEDYTLFSDVCDVILVHNIVPLLLDDYFTNLIAYQEGMVFLQPSSKYIFIMRIHSFQNLEPLIIYEARFAIYKNTKKRYQMCCELYDEKDQLLTVRSLPDWIVTCLSQTYKQSQLFYYGYA